MVDLFISYNLNLRPQRLLRPTSTCATKGFCNRSVRVQLPPERFPNLNDLSVVNVARESLRIFVGYEEWTERNSEENKNQGTCDGGILLASGYCCQ